MAEQATIDGNPADAPPEVRSEGFQNMAKQLEGAMASFHKPPTEAPPLDTRPVEAPPLKKETKAETKPAEKAPEKPASPAEKKEDEPFVSPKAADWKKLKAERDEWQKKATEHEAIVKTHSEKAAALEKEYSEFKAKSSVDPKQVDELKKAIEERDAKLERIALSETPKFRDYYNSKFEAAIGQALDAAGKDKGDQVRALLEAPKSAWRKGILNEMITGMENEVDKLSLLDAVNKYDAARSERDRELDNHKSALRELASVEQRHKQEQDERRAANRKAYTAEILKRAEAFASFKPSDDPEHNAQVERNKRLVEDFLNEKLDSGVVGLMPVLASHGEFLERTMKVKDAKIAELEEALKKYQTAAPALEGGGDPKPEPQSSGASYTEQVKANLAAMRQAKR